MPHKKTPKKEGVNLTFAVAFHLFYKSVAMVQWLGITPRGIQAMRMNYSKSFDLSRCGPTRMPFQDVILLFSRHPSP